MSQLEESSRPILLGTRGSPLARRQAELVLGELRRHHPDRAFSLKVVATLGDRNKETPLSSMAQEGIFVKEIEAALLAGEIDLAVHSLKDLPTAPTPGVALAAIPQRGEVRDALVSTSGRSLEELPKGARLGTSSPRRALQLRAFRPDLVLLPIRGNVDTRLRKLEAGQYEAIVVAAAGLERLELEARITQYLSPEACLPAVGQGALAVQARANDREVISLASPLNHYPSRQEVEAERAFLEALGGGCRIPIAALARARPDLSGLELEGLVAREDSLMLRARLKGDIGRAEELGRALARRLLEMGAAEIVGEVAE